MLSCFFHGRQSIEVTRFGQEYCSFPKTNLNDYIHVLINICNARTTLVFIKLTHRTMSLLCRLPFKIKRQQSQHADMTIIRVEES